MGATGVEVHEPIKKAKMLRVRVVDLAKDGKPVVNVNMPIGIVKFGMKIAQAFSPELKDAQIDWESLTALIESGELGKLVEVDDEAEQKHVEVWVD